jgi:type VI secretion system secreted protein VgrG
MTVLDVVEDVFDTQGYSDYDIRCTRSYPERDYCVQYRESHLDFVSRLLEEEGIFYFFEHGDSGHTLVLADHNSAFAPCPGQEEAPMGQASVPEEDVVTGLVEEHTVSAGEVSLADFDYLQPSLSLQSNITGDGEGEIRDYHPRRFTSREEGDRKARLLMETEEARRRVVRGESGCRAFRSGHRFELYGAYRSGGQGGADYRNEFTAIPHDVPFRPRRETDKPEVRGAQTAVVVGKEGEEIWTDEHGRIKVQFHWDREGRSDENSSCWLRVASRWAGKSWGDVHIPRIGQEVVVDFLEGDPDRPIVTGSVYNADYPPPYDLPSEKTRSGVKSRSSKEGASGDFNEIRLEDKKGSEEIRVHAEKNLTTVVENDERRKVYGSRHTTVGDSDSPAADDDFIEKTEVHGGRGRIVDGDESVIVKGADGRAVTVERGNHGLKVEMGDNKLDVDMGDNLTKVKLGSDKKEALTSIEMKVGPNKIKIDQTGITIEGLQVKVEGTSMLQAKSPMTTVEGKGMLQLKASGMSSLKGGLVLIN